MVETNVKYKMMTVCEERGEGERRAGLSAGQQDYRQGTVSQCGQGRLLTRGDVQDESSKKTGLPGLAVEGQERGSLDRGALPGEGLLSENVYSPCAAAEGRIRGANGRERRSWGQQGEVTGLCPAESAFTPAVCPRVIPSSTPHAPEVVLRPHPTVESSSPRLVQALVPEIRWTCSTRARWVCPQHPVRDSLLDQTEPAPCSSSPPGLNSAYENYELFSSRDFIHFPPLTSHLGFLTALGHTWKMTLPDTPH